MNETSFKRSPVLKGHFLFVPEVTSQYRFDCIFTSAQGVKHAQKHCYNTINLQFFVLFHKIPVCLVLFLQIHQHPIHMLKKLSSFSTIPKIMFLNNQIKQISTKQIFFKSRYMYQDIHKIRIKNCQAIYSMIFLKFRVKDIYQFRIKGAYAGHSMI